MAANLSVHDLFAENGAVTHLCRVVRDVAELYIDGFGGRLK